MAELTNPQVALQAAAESCRRVEGDAKYDFSASDVISRANTFLDWLDKQDRRN